MGTKEFYVRYLKGLQGGGVNGQAQAKCPFHEDRDPSFSVNLDTGQCKCFACGFKGDAFSFYQKLKGVSFPEAKRELAKWGILPLKERTSVPRPEKKTSSPPAISEQTVERFVKALPGKAVEFLKDKRGLSEEVISKYKIGWMAQKKRFSTPVANNGKYVNIRLWSPTEKPKIFSWSQGRGISLFPLDQLESNGELFLCEGEMDALCAISHGLAAVTVTGGAGSWQDEWTLLFKGKKVNITYDCDSTGRNGATKIAKILLPVAGEIRVVDLGLEDREDVTDWFVKYKKTAKELTELVSRSERLVAPGRTDPGEKKKGTKEKIKTFLPGVIHLVQDNGQVKYLLKQKDGLNIQEVIYCDDTVYRPKQDLPFKILSSQIIETPKPDYEKLFDEVVDFIKAYLEMPSETDYLVLSLWVFHTYLIEKFNTTPILYFYGVKETGKTRAGEILGELAFRCERLTSPTEASLFRSANYFKTTLVIDEIKLWGVQGNQEVANLIKSRYKRGLKVSRVNLNKSGEDQIEYFDVFAPLVICTTESIPDTIESRCIVFLMQKNSNAGVEKLIDENRAKNLRNQLTLFRADYLDKNLAIPERVARRRLNEIMIPLYQILMLVAPQRVDEFKEVVGGMEKTKAEEEGLSLEAEIVEGIAQYQKETGRKNFLTTELTEKLNKTRDDEEKLGVRLVSMRIRRLGFQKTRLKNGKRGFIVNQDLVAKLKPQFGID